MYHDCTGKIGIDLWNGCVIGKGFFRVFPCLITYCEKKKETFSNHFLPSSQKVEVFPKISLPVWLGSPGSAVSQPMLKRNGCRMCKVGTWFPQERNIGVMGNRCGCFSHLVFVSLTQLSGIHSVCMRWHTPYHPSGRLLTLSSQIQGTGHSSYQVTLCLVLFTFTWKVGILLVNSK